MQRDCPVGSPFQLSYADIPTVSQEQGCPSRGGIRRKLEANSRPEVHESHLRLWQLDELMTHNEVRSHQVKVRDKRVLRLIRMYLNAGVLENGVVVRSEEGTPQGGPLSPLLANILLDDFDRELTKRGHKFVRYADDCNVYVKSRRAGERVMASLTKYLEEGLKLKVNREKSAVDRPQKRKLPGFSFLYGKQALIRLADKTIERFRDKVCQVTNRTRSMRLSERIRQLNTYMMGWVAYFRLAQMKGHCERFDEWVRRRLRMCIWKQWKRVKTRYTKLRTLGQPERLVHVMANSRRGPWFMAKNLNQVMDKAYFEALGLRSLQERYLQLRSVS